MKIIKKYLTSEELAFIVNTINQEEDLVTKEILKVALVAQCCIDEFQEIEEGTTCNDIYDKIVSYNEQDIIGDMATRINNWYAIDKCINGQFINFSSKAIEEIGKSIENLSKGIDMNSILKSLEDAKGMIK